ncbi:MAG TPA: adenylyltransferase, partial [Desulfobacterales bacterium]|nr:adenylyltransferase [Desulfobacterales bacterium]
MSHGDWVEPYGGELVDLRVNKDRQEVLKDLALNLPEVILNDRQMCDLELLGIGAFSPLRGFLTRADYESVLDRMRLQDGLLWPVPICLDVNRMQAESLEAGQSLALRDQEGFLLAVMHVEDIWPIDKERECHHVFGTLDKDHPGVQYIMGASGDYYVG